MTFRWAIFFTSIIDGLIFFAIWKLISFEWAILLCLVPMVSNINFRMKAEFPELKTNPKD